MKIPNYLYEEFVDNNILNNGFAQVLTSMQIFPSIGQLFLPGIINPSGLIFSFHANLIVTLTANASLLFGSGALTTPHGITNGVDSNIYNVNFAGLVPGIGSVTAYIVAQYGQIQENSTVILGAPPGHPDYSANFVPYVGYTTLQDTWNVFATTSPPDNFTTFELARTTLTVGQTSIVTVDTSHQHLAGLNLSPGTFGIAGDVTGTLASTIVQRSSAATFFANNINAAGNITAAALAVAGNVTAGADVIAELDIGAGRDADITRNVNAGGIITATLDVDAGRNVNAGGIITAIGEIFGANGTVANSAAMLGQFGGRVNVPGPNFSTYFHISIFDSGTNSVQRVLVEFGNVQPGGGIGSGATVPVTFPLTYATIVGSIIVTNLSEGGFISSGSIVAGSTGVSGFTYVNNGPTNTVGFTWLSIGL